MENEINPNRLATDETWRDEPIKKRKRVGWPKGKPRGSRKAHYEKSIDPRGVPVKVPKVDPDLARRIRTPANTQVDFIFQALSKTLLQMEQAPLAAFPALMGQMRAILMMAGHRD